MPKRPTIPTVHVYTDGSCYCKSRIGGWAFQLRTQVPETAPAWKVQEQAGSAEDTTNNEMELTAIIRALELLASKPERLSSFEVRVFSDSNYALNCLRGQWAERWIQTGWVNGAGKPVSNRELIERGLRAVAAVREVALDLYLIHVKGHSGHPHNERVDYLANTARNERNAGDS